jgi:fibronectin type 3 domain-containing protein
MASPPATATSHTDPDLRNGQTYYYRLSAVDTEQRESARTAAVPVTPSSAAAPAVPTGLTATPGDGQVLLQWNANPEPDVATYRLYRALAQNGNYVRLDPPVQHPATSYPDTNVTNGVTYYYRLTAVNLAGLESNRTEFVSATPQATVAPTTPTDFTATPGDKQVVLTWNANPEGDLADYRLFRSDSAGGDFTVVATVTAPVTTFTDTNLVNGQPYFYRLTARNLNGLESAPTQPPVSVTPVSATPPSFPQGLDVQAQFDRLILVWTANPEPDLKEYRVYRAVDNLNVPTSADGAAPYAVVPRQTTTSIDRDVTADHIYYYRITAVNLANLESAPSIPAQGRPGQPKVQLLAPGDGQTFLPERQIDLEKNQETRVVTIQFGWNPVANASRYLFELAEDPSITRLVANELILASGTPVHEFTITMGPLTPIGVIVGAKDLYWRITAVNDNNVVIDRSQVWGVTIDWDG